MSDKIKEAFNVLKEEMKDEDYAWAWHCNIAVSFMDENGTHEQANRAAARIMKTLFDVDVSEFKNFEDFEKYWNK